MSLDTPYVFRCLLSGISEEHRALVAKHGTLTRDTIAKKLGVQKVMATEQVLETLDQILHQAIKDALLKEEQLKKPSIVPPAAVRVRGD